MESHWRRCSSCKKDLAFEQTYWVCNVSTCNRKRTGLVFCSVECWDAHLPSMRHRESWAEERRAPRRQDWQLALERERSRAPGARTSGATLVSEKGTPAPLQLCDDFPVEILVVASKLKSYIKARAEMKTSDAVFRVLSDRLRKLCDEAIRSAHSVERKTVLDRDFPD